MSALAAQGVRPVCPGCGRPVRSGVELARALADVRDGAGEGLLGLAAIRAELDGEHLACLLRTGWGYAGDARWSHDEQRVYAR